MGYRQYKFGRNLEFMGCRPHGKDWLPAELYPSIFSGTLIVKKDTKGKDGSHEKRIDRFSVYCFAVGNTYCDNVDYWRSCTSPRSENP